MISHISIESIPTFDFLNLFIQQISNIKHCDLHVSATVPQALANQSSARKRNTYTFVNYMVELVPVNAEKRFHCFSFSDGFF